MSSKQALKTPNTTGSGMTGDNVIECVNFFLFNFQNQQQYHCQTTFLNGACQIYM